jgi:2'-5' RNA ligase
MLRLFFALQPTPDQGEELLANSAALAVELGGQRVPPGNLHVTLCFIGAVAPEKLYLILETASRVRGAPVTLCFEAFEYWEKPRVLCATAPAATWSTASKLSQALAEATIAAGFAPDAKPFRAHLTLARKLNVDAAMRVEWPRPMSPPLTLRCDRFALMESRRGESGSLYSVVESWPLDASQPL